MAGALKAAEAAAPTRPHPNAPESAVGNVLASPPIAVFDRVRDAVREWREKNPEDWPDCATMLHDWARHGAPRRGSRNSLGWPR
jgi:hypothetical protein